MFSVICIWTERERASFCSLCQRFSALTVQNYGDRGDVAECESGAQSSAFPQERISRLTERFYRVDMAKGRVRGGTGLGLAIVKHILRRHGTRLEVRSTLDEGSWFSFELLPASARRQIETPGSESAGFALPGRRQARAADEEAAV